MQADRKLGEVCVDEAGSETVVVRLLGEHDMTTKDTLESTLREQVGGDQGVVVSLLETEFMDSSVVKALFETDALLRARGRRLAIHVNTASIVRRVLEISNISTLMSCTGSLDEAVRIASTVETES